MLQTKCDEPTKVGGKREKQTKVGGKGKANKGRNGREKSTEIERLRLAKNYRA